MRIPKSYDHKGVHTIVVRGIILRAFNILRAIERVLVGKRRQSIAQNLNPPPLVSAFTYIGHHKHREDAMIRSSQEMFTLSSDK